MEESLFAAHHQLENRHWWFRGRRRAIRELGLLLVPEDGSVVDVGCGTGADIASFPPSLRRHGIDVSPTAVAFARRSHPDVTFEVGAVPAAGADAISGADLVLLCDVLEHIEEDATFLSALGAVIKPGARLLLTVPADPRLWSPHDDVYGHFRRYTRGTLAAAWIDTPFLPRLVAPLNRRLYPLARLVRTASAIRGQGWGKARSDLGLPPVPINRVLEYVFAGEAAVLTRALAEGRAKIRGRGVSLLAVLERTHTSEHLASPAATSAVDNDG